MKNFTNTSRWGKLTLLLNVVVLVFFILSMIFLMKFDKKNIVVVTERDTYEQAYEDYVMAQHPLKQDSAEVEYYQYKLDTLQQKTAASKDEKKALAESIDVTKNTLKEKKQLMEDHIAAVKELEDVYAPLNENWENINADKDAAKKVFVIFAVITGIFFIIKLVLFGKYNYENSKNIHSAAKWMKNGIAPWWSFAGWFIPVINLMKPLSVFKEIWEETDYVLEDKAIVSVPKDTKDTMVDNSGLHLGIWWALLLCSCWLMNFVLFKTFFSEGALFVKANHGAMTIIAITVMILCMLEEVYLILTYNKKNAILVENADKFETAE